MLGSFLAWIIETVLGATWHRFFPPKSNVEKANAVQNKVVSMSDATVSDELRDKFTRSE